jgi:hypothetical protein
MPRGSLVNPDRLAPSFGKSIAKRGLHLALRRSFRTPSARMQLDRLSVAPRVEATSAIRTITAEVSFEASDLSSSLLIGVRFRAVTNWSLSDR